MNGQFAWIKMSFSVLVLSIYPFSIRMSLFILFMAYSFPSTIFTTRNTLPNDPLSITFFILKSSRVTTCSLCSSRPLGVVLSTISEDTVSLIVSYSFWILSGLFRLSTSYLCRSSLSIMMKSSMSSSPKSSNSPSFSMSCKLFSRKYVPGFLDTPRIRSRSEVTKLARLLLLTPYILTLFICSSHLHTYSQYSFYRTSMISSLLSE